MNSILNLPLPLIPLCETAFKFHHINGIHMKPNLCYLCSKVILTIILKNMSDALRFVFIYKKVNLRSLPQIFSTIFRTTYAGFWLSLCFTHLQISHIRLASFCSVTVISLKEGTQISKNCIHLQTEELALVLEKLM